MLGSVDKGCLVCGASAMILCHACEQAYQDYLAGRKPREGTRAGMSSQPVKTGRPANPWTRFQWAAFQRTRRDRGGSN